MFNNSLQKVPKYLFDRKDTVLFANLQEGSVTLVGYFQVTVVDYQLL